MAKTTAKEALQDILEQQKAQHKIITDCEEAIDAAITKRQKIITETAARVDKLTKNSEILLGQISVANTKLDAAKENRTEVQQTYNGWVDRRRDVVDQLMVVQAKNSQDPHPQTRQSTAV